MGLLQFAWGILMTMTTCKVVMIYFYYLLPNVR